MGEIMRGLLKKEEALKLSKEVAKLVLDKNLTIREAEIIVLEKYKKSCSCAGKLKAQPQNNQ